MSAEYTGPSGSLLGDEEPDPDVDRPVDATLAEVPADEQPADGQTQQQAQQSEQPEAAVTGDTDGVVKDPKSWDRLTQVVAEFTGKETAEVKAMPFTQRMDLLKTHRDEITAKLDKLSEFEDFVGIKIDAPAEQWNPIDQISQLPSNHQNKLIDSVMRTYLPYMAEETLKAPSKYPDELGLLRQVASTLAQAAYQRPIDETDAIMQMFEGMNLQQIRGLVSGGNGYQAPQSLYPPSQPYAPTANVAPLYDMALKAGMDLSDPTSPEVQFVSQMANLINRMQADTSRQIAALENQFGQVNQRTSQFEQQQKQTVAEQAHAAIDSQAEAARTTLLDQVTNGKLPEGREVRLKQLILNDAKAALSADQRAQAALQLAKDYQADGVENKAKGQFSIYLNRLSHHLTEAAKTVLTEVTVPGQQARRQQDQRKAAQRHLGAPAGGQLTPASLQAIANRRIKSPDDAADAVMELYRNSQTP